MRLRRNRPAVALAAIGIIALSVFGGSMSAAADPPTGLTIDQGSQDTLATTIAISGTVTPSGGGWDTLIEVWSPADPVTPVCSISIPYTDTVWACPAAIPLAEGYNDFYAIAYDNDGEPDEYTPPTPTITIARGGYEFPVIQVPAFGDSTDDATPLFSGVGPVLGFIEMNGPFGVVCNATVDSAGFWSCEATAPIAPDTYGSFWARSTFIDSSPGDDGSFHTITINPAKPALSYSVGSAAVTATAIGAPTGDVSVELYRVTDGPTGYSYDIAAGCPALIDMLEFMHERNYGGSSVTCPFTGLAPGIWNVYSGQVVDGHYSNFQNDFIRVPTTPTIAARVNANNSVTISGTAQAGGLVYVQTPGYANVCQAAVVGTRWSCTVTPSPGLRRYIAFAQDQGFVADTGGEGQPADNSYQGQSAYSSRVSVTVPEPVVPLAIRAWTMAVTAPNEVEPGEEVEIEVADAPPGAGAAIEIHSTPVALGSAVVGADGTLSTTVTIPEDTEPGEHHIVVIFTPTDGSAPTQVEHPITVMAPPSSEEPVVLEGAASGSGASLRHEPGAPTALSSALSTPADLISNPLVAATAGSLGLALVLLVLVPAEFFGETLASHYAGIAAFIDRRKRLSRASKAIGRWVGSHRLISGIALVLLTSAVFSFVDPSFGFDLASLRLLLSCAVSILLVNFASAGITELVAERAWGVPTRLKVMPWGLAIAIVGVIASRILDFSPGFLIGSIIGVGIIGEVAPRLGARVILLWSAVVWALAVGSWALIGLVPVLPASDPGAFWTALLSDSLVATSAAGLTALLVALLPIALFDGGELFAYSKRVWAIAFGIAAATFCVVVVPSAANWMGLGDGLLGWLLLTLGFVALAIVAYVFARRRSATKRSRLLTAE